MLTEDNSMTISVSVSNPIGECLHNDEAFRLCSSRCFPRPLSQFPHATKAIQTIATLKAARSARKGRTGLRILHHCSLPGVLTPLGPIALY